MEHNITEELRGVQEELRRLKAELVALGRVVEEVVFLQALVALDTAGEPCERAATAVRVLRKVADMATMKSPLR
jgi:hypothetical protein